MSGSGGSARYAFLKTDFRQGVFFIRMARPPLNVLHEPLMAEIAAALDHAAQSHDVSVVVVTGQSRAFSAGVEVSDHEPERVEASMDDFFMLLNRLETYPLPTIAALNGYTLGGGLELALSCDMMIAVPDAKIGHPEIKLASVAFFGILMLQKRLPGNLITELLVGGDPIDATEAHRIGLVNQLVSKDTFEDDVFKFASRFACHSRPVLSLMMRTLKAAQGKTLKSGFAEAKKLYLEELLPLEDVSEGLNAFAEKRPPLWKHR